MRQPDDIATFTKSHDFYGEINLLLTIKSFDLQAIRARWLKSRQRNSGKTGSVERRKPAIGGIVKFSMAGGKVTNSQLIMRGQEPRGIHVNNGRIAYSLEDSVHVIDDNHHYLIRNNWFSYIHTVELSPFNPDHILISSSGLDTVMEFNYKELRLVREWCAWEHGFNQSTDPVSGKPILLTRNEHEAISYQAQGKNFRFVRDGIKDHLPTAMRAAFINSAYYMAEEKDKIVATFFHRGEVSVIDFATGRAEVCHSDLQNPHGGRFDNSQFFVTSTGAGEVISVQDNEVSVFNFKNLKGKPRELASSEWLQNSILTGDNYITIDSNRNAFIVFNPKIKQFDMIAFDDNWAIQDLVNIPAGFDLSTLWDITRPTL